MTRRKKKWDPERLKVAIEAMRNNATGSYKPSRIFILPQATPERYVKDREKSQVK